MRLDRECSHPRWHNANPNQTPDMKPCETCGSLGWLHDPKGHFEEGDANPKFTVDCPTCHGTGTVEPQPAPDSADDLESLQDVIVAHHFDTTAGRRIDDEINKCIAALEGEQK